MEEQWYEKAMEVLEPLERTPDTEAQWQQLAAAALDAVRDASGERTIALLAIAERCYAAVGDVARSRYLRKLRKKNVAGDVEAIRAGVRRAARTLALAKHSTPRARDAGTA